MVDIKELSRILQFQERNILLIRQSHTNKNRYGIVLLKRLRSQGLKF